MRGSELAAIAHLDGCPHYGDFRTIPAIVSLAQAHALVGEDANRSGTLLIYGTKAWHRVIGRFSLKIGSTRNLASRMGSLRGELCWVFPGRGVLFWYISRYNTREARTLETQIQFLCSDHVLPGCREWFQFTPWMEALFMDMSIVFPPTGKLKLKLGKNILD